MHRIFYHNILSQMQTFYDAFYTKPKRGRNPKISLPQIATLFLMYYITNAPLLTSTMIILLKTLSGKKLRLIVDGTILPVANVNRARTQKIKRFTGGVFWAKRKRNIYSQHYKGRVK